MGKLGQGMGALRVGWNPRMNYYPLSFQTVFHVFKVLKNLLDSYSYILATNFNVFIQTPTPTPS